MDSNRPEKAPAARRWRFPPRALNQWVTVVALSGLAMAALSPRGGVAPAPRLRFASPPPPATATARNWAWTAPPPELLVQPWAPDSRFVVAAPEGLDPRFVVAAPQGIDDRIIANPGSPPVRYEALPGSPRIWVIPAPAPPAGPSLP